MKKQILALAAAGAIALSACGTGGGTTPPPQSPTGTGTATAPQQQDVALTWWHNSNSDPGKGYYEQVAKAFEADHPGVTIEISAMQHEDMVTKLEAAWQSGDVPDIYMERGGGELADKVKVGLVKEVLV